MRVIRIKHTGNFDLTERFLMAVGKIDHPKSLEKLGKDGVEAVRAATPVDTGKTKASWFFHLSENDKGWVVSWNNLNTNRWANIAALIEWGHGMPDGTYIEGIDYVKPAIMPLIDKFTDGVWEEVIKSGKRR